MSYLESIVRFFGWWCINIDMLLVAFFFLGTLLFFFKHIPCGRALIFISLSGFTLLSCLPLGVWTVTLLENRFPQHTALPPHAKGIILLGGSFDLSNSKDRSLPVYNLAAGRLIEFVQLVRKYPALAHVFTGTPLEVTLAKREFAGLGLNPQSVLFEDSAANTYSNATNTARILHPTSEEVWVLVTSACHMPRAAGLFRKAGFTIFPYPVDYHTSGKYKVFPLIGLKRNLDAWHVGVRELLSIFTNYLLGRSDSFFPGP